MPRLTETKRMPSAMVALITRWMPSAACSTGIPRGRAIFCSIACDASSRLELHRTAGEVIGIDIAEHDGGIGDGRIDTAAAITCGAGLGTGGAWTDPQRARRIEPRDAAAACSDRIHIDHRHPDRVTVEPSFRRDQRLPAFDERDVGARAADIDRDEIVETGGFTRSAPADHAGCRPRQKKTNRAAPGHVR